MISVCNGIIFPIFILLGGMYFLVVYRHDLTLKRMCDLRPLLASKKERKSLTLALAGTLGVGNIVGTVNALRIGGEGAVFWMLISSILSARLKYAEAKTASETKKKRGSERYGGAFLYIEKAYSRFGRQLAVIFALFFILSSLSTGSALQATAAAKACTSTCGSISPLLISFLLSAVTLLAAVNGAGKISDITSKLVPVMTSVYLILCASVIIKNIFALPSVVKSIITSAFDGSKIIFGIGWFGVTEGVRCGVMRGLLSNEAGSGSSASAHATGTTDDPHLQGLLGAAEVYVDTTVMCTVTALALLMSNYPIIGNSDILIAKNAFSLVGGSLYSALLSGCILTFAYATLICFYAYGSGCIEYIFKNNSKTINYAFLTAFIATIALSPIIPESLTITLADLSLGVMSVINIPALIILTKKRREHPSGAVQ